MEELLKDSNFKIEKCAMFSDTRPLKNTLAKFFVPLGSIINPNLRDKIIIVASAFGETRKAFPASVDRLFWSHYASVRDRRDEHKLTECTKQGMEERQ